MTTNPAERFYTLAGASREEAGFMYSCLPTKVADRTWFVCTVAGVTAFETDDGLVLVDTGMKEHAQKVATELREHASAPVHTVIYTHHHIDHAFGTPAFLIEGQDPPQVIGQRAMAADFARYDQTPNYNFLCNLRQARGVFDPSAQQSGSGNVIAPILSSPDMPPNILYDEGLTIEVGNTIFELHSARGETDDCTWVYCPERDVLCCGDLIIWAISNSGNPQKVQRYLWEWAKALREMAALKPKTLCPGHGGPAINEPELIQQILLETASYLESIVEQTLRAIEDGAPPHVDIVHSIKIPPTDSPWLQELHASPEFICRDVIRFYTGWYTGRPSELKPAPRAAVAAEIAQLAGGAIALADRALAIAGNGDFRLACHLADYALEATPEDTRVQEVVAQIYHERASSETGLMSVN